MRYAAILLLQQIFPSASAAKINVSTVIERHMSRCLLLIHLSDGENAAELIVSLRKSSAWQAEIKAEPNHQRQPECFVAPSVCVFVIRQKRNSERETSVINCKFLPLTPYPLPASSHPA